MLHAPYEHTHKLSPISLVRHRVLPCSKVGTHNRLIKLWARVCVFICCKCGNPRVVEKPCSKNGTYWKYLFSFQTWIATVEARVYHELQQVQIQGTRIYSLCSLFKHTGIFILCCWTCSVAPAKVQIGNTSLQMCHFSYSSDTLFAIQYSIQNKCRKVCLPAWLLSILQTPDISHN